jgi:hypothetical protein
MRDIVVSLTDRGLEVLFDGKPSPRFERYMRNVRSLVKYVRLSSRILVRGPVVALAWAILVSMLDGSLQLNARSSDNSLHVQLHFTAAAGQPPLAGECTDVERSSGAGIPACDEPPGIGQNDSGKLLQYFQLIYLFGMWFGIDDVLRDRRRGSNSLADSHGHNRDQ